MKKSLVILSTILALVLILPLGQKLSYSQDSIPNGFVNPPTKPQLQYTSETATNKENTANEEMGISVTKLFTIHKEEDIVQDSTHITISSLNSFHSPKITSVYETVESDGSNYSFADDDGPNPTRGWLGSPLNYMKVAWGFGPRSTGIPGASTYHLGVDLYAACGQKVYAAQGGTVEDSEYLGATGNFVLINHGIKDGNHLSTRYLHLSKRIATVGEHVKKGQLIGYAGETGIAVGCHLHFEVLKNGGYPSGNVNPMTYY